MIRSFLTATVLGLAIFGGGDALAQGVAQPGFYKGDLAAFHGDAQSLIHALTFFHESSDARVVEIRFTDRGGHPGYHVVLQRQGRVAFVHVDERSDRIIEFESASLPAWMLNGVSRTRLRFDRKAQVTLAQAIRTAEVANDGAPAIAAGIARSASNPASDVHAYNVLLDVSGTTRRVSIDSATGQIISDPQSLSDWP